MAGSKRLTRRQALGLGAATALFAGPAAGQDWFNRGLEILEGVTGSQTQGTGLSNGEIVQGLKEALRVGTDRSISQIGRVDGYLLDKFIRIPLPNTLARAQNILRPVGFSGLLDDLETRLNRAAETGAPFAKGLFYDAISAMSVTDAVDILQGPDDSATQYFRGAMGPGLKGVFRPVIDRELSDAGAFTSLASISDRLSGMPIGNQVSETARDDLTDHGLNYALDGLFYYVGKEEAAIRNNPVKRTSEILRKVFG